MRKRGIGAPEVLPGTATQAREIERLEEQARQDAEIVRRQAIEARARRRLIARTDINEFCAQVGRDAENGARITQDPIHEDFQIIADEYPRAIVMAFPESGKALAVDTLIPTPRGMVPLAFIEKGDRVLGGDGRPCTVTFATPFMANHVVYRVTFDDGGEILADAEHRWLVKHVDEERSAVRTTQDMVDMGVTQDGNPCWYIPVCGPAEHGGCGENTGACVVAPYVLGMWLRGDDITGVGDQALSQLGLSKPTHIPAVYLNAPITQRRELLSGLLMSRDAVNVSSRLLAHDIMRLARSLGHLARLDGNGGGHRVHIDFDATRRGVRSIERATAVAVRCIQVDSPNHTFLAGTDYTVTHNTSQLSILRPLYLMGRNPNIHIAIVSKTGITATKSARAIKEYIERNEDLQEVFPELLPGDTWQDNYFTIKRSSFSKDPTVQALGLGGTLIGSRVDVLIFDDILDDENTRTPTERKKVFRRVKAFMDRLSERGVMVILTNAWHPEDAVHVLESEGMPSFRFPVTDPEGRPAWPLKWNDARLAQVKTDLGPLEYARAFLCMARNEGESPFDQDKVNAAFDVPHLSQVHSLSTAELPPGAWIYTGVDLAATKRQGSHFTALSTVLLWPETDGTLSRQLLWAVRGRWSSYEIREQILDHDRRYTPTFIVENNACFPPGTIVLTERGKVPIDRVNVGDVVFTHLGRWRKVVRTFVHEHRGELLQVRAGREEVWCTPEHPFWVCWTSTSEPEWMQARHLDIFRKCAIVRSVHAGYSWARVRNVDTAPYRGPVHNIEVEEDHSYVADGFVVHNCQRWIIDIVQNQADLPLEERRTPELIPFTTGKNKAHATFGVEGVAVEVGNGQWMFPENGPVREHVQQLKTEMMYYSRGGHTGDLLMSLWFAREGVRRGVGAGKAERPSPRELAPATYGDGSVAGVRVYG